MTSVYTLSANHGSGFGKGSTVALMINSNKTMVVNLTGHHTSILSFEGTEQFIYPMCHCSPCVTVWE